MYMKYANGLAQKLLTRSWDTRSTSSTPSYSANLKRPLPKPAANMACTTIMPISKQSG